MKLMTVLSTIALVVVLTVAGCVPIGSAAPAQPQPTAVPTPTEAPPVAMVESGDALQTLAPLYDELNRGVVLIQVIVARGGQRTGGTGSGFILDNDGHIVTNDHVVSRAEQLIVTFFDGFQARAEVVGTDDDSDLAVIRVDELPDNVHPLPLGDLGTVAPGDWVVAIGSPFGLGSTMTAGIISAVGRTIPTGATPFSIPEAIQTDAAINPGNSGGPLLNLEGEVIGVNAVIATQTGTFAGVGFAIPVSIVERVAPVLIEEGAYEWPWLGVEGTAVDLLLQEANDLPTQRGAYVSGVAQGGPAAGAGLQGTQTTRTVDGLDIPAGGDVVIALNGTPIVDFSALTLEVGLRRPGDEITLTILRDGEELDIEVTLAPRPN